MVPIRSTSIVSAQSCPSEVYVVRQLRVSETVTNMQIALVYSWLAMWLVNFNYLLQSAVAFQIAIPMH